MKSLRPLHSSQSLPTESKMFYQGPLNDLWALFTLNNLYIVKLPKGKCYQCTSHQCRCH